jgi:hypothetical protein
MSTEKTLWVIGGTVAGVTVLSVVAFVAAQKIVRDAARSAVENAADAVARDAIRIGREAASVGAQYITGPNGVTRRIPELTPERRRQIDEGLRADEAARMEECARRGGRWTVPRERGARGECSIPIFGDGLIVRALANPLTQRA